ncbi:MAG: hypothetical protein H6712_10275 [Myxococcales bacterium]|nr:hypothetical protein [Myxococcales bacterium]
MPDGHVPGPLSDRARRRARCGPSSDLPRSWHRDWGEEHFAKGRVEGEAWGEASAILERLDFLGLSPDPALRHRILACTDLEPLDRWLRAAVTARSLDELRVP